MVKELVSITRLGRKMENLKRFSILFVTPLFRHMTVVLGTYNSLEKTVLYGKTDQEAIA
jgi:hypothetical protein